MISQSPDKLSRSIILCVLILVILFVIVAIGGIRAYGPRKRAEAERLLWTPAPTPTAHPDVAHAKIQACQAVYIAVIIAAYFALLAFVAWVFSAIARHIRTTIQVEPQPRVKALSGIRPTLIGSGAIYDPRFNTQANINDVNEPNLEQGQIVLDAECAKADALTQVLAAIMVKRPPDRTCAERKMLERYEEKVHLIEEGKVDVE